MVLSWICIFLLVSTALARDGEGNKKPDQKWRKEKEKDKEELLLVNAYWRHGQTGLEGFDIAKKPPTPRVDPGALSDLFNLGQLLRNRYVRDLKFLDPAKFEDVVYFRSVDDYRALTQTQAVQAAMAPSTEKIFREVKDWPSDWEPIALHTLPEQEDYILHPVADCPSYYRAQVEAVKAYVASVKKDERSLYDSVIGSTGLPYGTSAADLARALLAISQVEPVWKEGVLDKVRVMAKEETKEYAKSRDMVRLRAGPLLQEIVNRMRAKVEASEANVTAANTFVHNLRFYAYAQASDPRSTINDDFWQLSALSDDRFPHDPLTTSILYELWRAGKEYFVSVRYCYKCDEKNDFKRLAVKGCPNTTDLCPLATFEEAVKPYLGITTLEEKQEACGEVPAPAQAKRASAKAKAHVATAREDYSVLAIVFGIVVGVLVIVCLNLFYMIMTQRREAQDGYVMVHERSSLLGK